MVSATGFMAIVSYITVRIFQLGANDLSLMATLPKFIVITIVSFMAYVIFSKMLKLSEADPVVRKIKKILFSQVRS